MQVCIFFVHFISSLVVGTNAVDCLDRFVFVSSLTLKSAHLFATVTVTFSSFKILFRLSNLKVSLLLKFLTMVKHFEYTDRYKSCY